MGLSAVDFMDAHLLAVVMRKGKLNEILTTFANLDNESKVCFVSELLGEYECPLLDKVREEGYKNATKSLSLREEGNKAFQSKKYIEAITLYTKCIAAAPFPRPDNHVTGEGRENPVSTESEELALGFGNRSAAFFHLLHFDDCVSDIDQALMFNCPAKVKCKLLVRKVKCFVITKKRTEEINNIKEEALDYLKISSLSEEMKQQMKDEILSYQQQSPVPTVDELWIIPYDKQIPIPPKSHGQHPHIPSASNCVEIKYNSKVGRCLGATRDIRPGDIIAIEKPYASTLDPSCFSTHCYNCLIQCCNLIPCEVCSTVMFCNEKCRSESWQTNHSIECTLLPLLLQLGISENELLGLRTVMKASDYGKKITQLYNVAKALEQEIHRDEKTKGFDHDDQYRSDSYSTLYHLTGNAEKRPTIDLFRKAFNAAYTLHFLKTYTDYFNIERSSGNTEHLMAMVGGLLFWQFQNTPYISYGVQEFGIILTSPETFSDTLVGCGVYSLTGLISHSCSPNVTRSFHRGDTIVLRAIQPIGRGEEILISYGIGYLSHDRNSRREKLRDLYQFTCECEACIHDWPLSENLPTCSGLIKCWACLQSLEELSVLAAAAVVAYRSGQKETNITDLKKLIQTITEMLTKSRRKTNLDTTSAGTTINYNKVILQNGRQIELSDRNMQHMCREYVSWESRLEVCFRLSSISHISSKKLTNSKGSHCIWFLS